MLIFISIDSSAFKLTPVFGPNLGALDLRKRSVFHRYDIVLDAAGLGETELQKFADYVNSCGSIVTLKSPLLENIDNYGLMYGSMKSAVDLALPNITSGILKKGALIKWAFFIPCSTAVKEISDLVNLNKVHNMCLHDEI